MWAEALKDALSKIVDTFNTGRLVFYTAAGFLFVLPCEMTLRLLVNGVEEKSTFFQQAAAFAKPGMETFVISIPVGFLIAIIGFQRVLTPLSEQLQADSAGRPLARSCYPSLYPLLANNDKESYHNWLITEYYRFVEIATFLPMGFMAGIFVLFVFTLLYLTIKATHTGTSGFESAYWILLLLAAVSSWLRLSAWPHHWIPKIVKPIITSHQSAKLELAEAVKQINKNKSSTPTTD